jgi:hypothetical protein
MPNPWVEFVRKWSLENNERYACSVGNPKCREEYYVIKEGKKTALKLEKEKERNKRIDDAETSRRHRENERDKAKKFELMETTEQEKKENKKFTQDISKVGLRNAMRTMFNEQQKNLSKEDKDEMARLNNELMNIMGARPKKRRK